MAQSNLAQAQAQEIKLAVHTLRSEQSQAKATEQFVQSECAALQRDEVAVQEKEESLKKHLAEHEAALKQGAWQVEDVHQAKEEAQDSRDARAGANSEDFFAKALTTGVPSCCWRPW